MPCTGKRAKTGGSGADAVGRGDYSPAWGSDLTGSGLAVQ